ncbi:Retrotransposon protein [Seminavis robusta]|uniref:Retrotransposon protein n=1 Tax=Seminavis robusta TaxID=568900 RepID=A0A9N8HXB1_9STRA|nr:Retrotransposon protein [Seminavis robusta]|eukprot:Sro1779_g297010.1 Retrotransposon protein (145) ;mRNA; r:17367-17801
MLPAPVGSRLSKEDGTELLTPEEQTIYRKGVGKLIHLTKMSRPETKNRLRELSRFMSQATQGHMAALKQLMLHYLKTPERGWFIKPNAKWDGKDKSFEFVIHGMSDAEYAGDRDEFRSVSGATTFLCGAPIAVRSKMQNIVTCL